MSSCYCDIQPCFPCSRDAQRSAPLRCASRLHGGVDFMTHPRTITALAALLLAAPAAAQEPLTDVTAAVNRKLVKLYGAGGFAGLNNFATGVLVSPKGHILTVTSSLLTEDLIAHLPDGRRYPAKLVVSEPALDVALLKLVAPPNRPEPDDLDYFDVTKAAARP